jgi:hypothetical protein
MIVLKITNASAIMATKVGKFLESLTSDSFDQSAVEDVLVRKLVENLQAEGLEGEVASVRGLDLKDKELILQDKLHVRSHHIF